MKSVITKKNFHNSLEKSITKEDAEKAVETLINGLEMILREKD